VKSLTRSVLKTYLGKRSILEIEQEVKRVEYKRKVSLVAEEKEVKLAAAQIKN
jgi:plastocyanin domain-containing protein